MRALFAKSIYAKKGQQCLTYSGALRPGCIRFKDEFQPFYSHYISAQECQTFSLHSREALPLRIHMAS